MAGKVGQGAGCGPGGPPDLRLLVGVLLLALLGCGAKDEKAVAGAAGPSTSGRGDEGLIEIPLGSPKLGLIRVETVRTAELPTQEVASPGKIEVNPNRVSRVVLPVPGRISSVMVRLGDAVMEGQPLLAIESPEGDAASSSYLQAEASVTQARAALVKAQADFDRYSDLYEHNAVAKKEVLNAESALAQAKAAVEQAQAFREQAVRRLGLLGLKPGDFGQKIVVRAPLAGKVLDIAVAGGEYRNDTSSALMTIADLSTVWVSSDVPESYIRFIQVGERVEIELFAYPGETFRGRVTRIADTVDAQTRTVKVRAEMDNGHARFRPEMFGRIRHVEAVQTFPVIPVGAVIQGDGKSVVFVAEGPGRFQQREVKMGKRWGDLVSVLAGLKPGERVVVDGAMLLREGGAAAKT